MSKNIPEIVINDFSTLFKLICENMYNPEQDKIENPMDYNPIIGKCNLVVFRGHKEECYKLESSLERYIRERFPKAIITNQLFERICNELQIHKITALERFVGGASCI